jgi:cytidine deaminase
MDPSAADLVEAATSARARAYAPYSGYRVGAAVRDEQGRLWSGCNVENVSYGLALCAERAAVAAMVAGGGRSVAEAAIVTQDGGTPCGMCLQTMLEFADAPGALKVHCVDGRGSATSFTLEELLPRGFRSASVPRTGGAAEPV